MPAWQSMPATVGCCTAATLYHHGTLDGHSHDPRVLTASESLIAHDRKRVRDNHARLAELYRRADPDLFIVCAHDSTLHQRAMETA